MKLDFSADRFFELMDKYFVLVVLGFLVISVVCTVVGAWALGKLIELSGGLKLK